MSRIPAVDPATATGAAKELLDAVQAKLGITPNLMRVMANEPAVLQAFLQLGETLGGGSLNPKQREAIALATAGANACGYCASAHSAIAGMMKVDSAEIEANLAGKSSDAKLNAGLDFARKVIETRGNVADADLDAVRSAGFSNGEVVEVVANVALNILTNYMNHVAGTDIDFPVVDAQKYAA